MTTDTARAEHQAKTQLNCIIDMMQKLQEAEGNERDEVEQEMREGPLSVEVRSAWQCVGEELEASEYMILLCTGGPAVRITGDLDRFNQPNGAKLQYQDWFTPWEDYCLTSNEEGILIEYAQMIYLG